jgi:hypothetical protein
MALQLLVVTKFNYFINEKKSYFEYLINCKKNSPLENQTKKIHKYNIRNFKRERKCEFAT